MENVIKRFKYCEICKEEANIICRLYKLLL